MSSVNSQINPEPLNFIIHTTKVGNKDCLEVGFTGLDTKTYDVATTVFKDPANLDCDSSQVLERIKYKHFVDTFFLSSGKEQLELWEKLRPPYSDDVKEKLEQSLKDPTNWSKIPPSLLTTSQLLEPLQNEVQEILLSQLDSKTIMFLRGEDEGAVRVRGVFLNALKNASQESNWEEVNRLTIAIEELSQSDQWIIETLGEVFENAVKANAKDSIKLLIPYALKMFNTKIPLLMASCKNLSPEVSKELLETIKSHSIYFDEGIRLEAIKNAAASGHLDIIHELFNHSFPPIAPYQIEQFLGDALLYAIESKHYEVAKELISKKENKIRDDKCLQAILKASSQEDSDPELILGLIEGLDPNSNDISFFRTQALLNAIKANNLSVAQSLISCKELHRDLYLSLIQASCEKNNFSLFEKILELIPEEFALIGRDYALEITLIIFNNFSFAKQILATDKPINLKSLEKAINHAVQTNNQEMVRAILSRSCLSSADFEEALILHGTALINSIKSNHLDIAREILASNEHIKLKDLEMAIIFAIEGNNLEIVHAIQNQGCLHPHDVIVLRGFTLAYSIKSNQLDIAREILQSNETIKLYDLEMAIIFAAESNNQEMVRAILSRSCLSSAEDELLRGAALVESIKSNHLDIALEILSINKFIRHQNLKSAIFYAARSNDNKDVIQAILARPSPSQEDTEDLCAYVFGIAIEWNQLDLAKAVSTQINKLDRDQFIQRSSVKTNREVFSLHLGLYNANEIPEDLFKSIVHRPDRSFSPDVFLELFLSDKLTESQVKLLRDEFKEYLSEQSRLSYAMEKNLFDKHQKINSILEQLSEQKIPYDYPFDCITWHSQGRLEFRLYRQALTDFPKDFLNIIAREGLPTRVVFLGESGIDAGGLFRDFIGYLIEGLNEQNEGIFNVDLNLGLPQLKESSPSDLEKTASKADFKLFGIFLAKLYDRNVTNLQALILDRLQGNLSQAEFRERYSPDVIGNCFDTHLFALLKLANNPQDLKEALKSYLKIRLFEKGALLGWAEQVPTSSANVAGSESWAVFTPKEYNNPSKGDKVDQLYVKLQEEQKSLKAIHEGQLFERADEIIALIEETKNELVDAYVQAGNPRPTHCVFFGRNPNPEQMLLAECVTDGLLYLGTTFENMIGSSFDEKLNDYCDAIKEIRSGLEEVSPSFILAELEADPIKLSRLIQGEGVTIDSLMKSLELPQNATQDMEIQKGWIREWLKKEPDNLTKFIKSIAGVSQLPPGKNIKLINKDRIFIHTCFFSMDLYGQLPPQVTKEKFFDRIEESLANKRFEGF